MSLETAILDLLEAYGTIASITKGEISPGMNYDGSIYPRIHYAVTSSEFVTAFQSIGTPPPQERRADLEVSILARVYSRGLNLAGQVEAALHGKRVAHADANIDRIILTNTANAIEPPDDASREPIHRFDLTFAVFWRATT